jgi:uncharacterized membrane protein YfcA
MPHVDIVAIAAVAFTLAGFVKGVVGFGFPVITLIILTLTIGLLDALAIIVIVINIKWPTAMLGAVLFIFALSRLLNVSLHIPPDWERPLSVPLGAINGMLTGLTGSFMVPSVLFMQAMGFQRDMLVQAMGIFFAISTIALATSLGRNDLISAEHLRLSFFALVPSIFGLYIGRWIRLKINEERFQRVFLVSVLLLGFQYCCSADIFRIDQSQRCELAQGK